MSNLAEYAKQIRTINTKLEIRDKFNYLESQYILDKITLSEFIDEMDKEVKKVQQ